MFAIWTIEWILKCLNHMTITLGFHHITFTSYRFNWLINMFEHKHAKYASTLLSKCDDLDDASVPWLFVLSSSIRWTVLTTKLKRIEIYLFSHRFVSFRFVSFLNFFRYVLFINFFHFFRFVFQTLLINSSLNFFLFSRFSYYLFFPSLQKFQIYRSFISQFQFKQQYACA
jgi:hypothetical protein